MGKTSINYSAQFTPITGAPASRARLAFGTLFIMQRLCFSQEEIFEQIREIGLHKVLTWFC
jgi:hypothetical protein